MSKEHIRELVVLSGKGGTGKTSVTASFALLAKKRCWLTVMLMLLICICC